MKLKLTALIMLVVIILGGITYAISTSGNSQDQPATQEKAAYEKCNHQDCSHPCCNPPCCNPPCCDSK